MIVVGDPATDVLAGGARVIVVGDLVTDMLVGPA